jgi:hypothetical protein
MFQSLVPSRWRLSPLFSQGAQILFFPAPISYLGERYLPAAGFPTERFRQGPEMISRGHSMSRIIESWLGRYYSSGLPSRVLEKKDVEEG